MLRLAPRGARAAQLPPVVFQAGSLSALEDITASALLEPGSTFVVELQLKQPVAAAFNLAGAESVFSPVVPPGLSLVDVRGVGTRTVVVEMRVDDEAEAAARQGLMEVRSAGVVTMGIAPAIAVVARFIAASWITRSLLAIGIFLTLDALVSGVTGRGIVERATGLPTGTVLLIAAAVVVLPPLLDAFRRRR